MFSKIEFHVLILGVHKAGKTVIPTLLLFGHVLDLYISAMSKTCLFFIPIFLFFQFALSTYQNSQVERLKSHVEGSKESSFG